MTGDD